MVLVSFAVSSCATSPSAITADAFASTASTSQRAVLDHQLEGAREQEVADQHRGLVAPDRVRGGAAAAQLARSTTSSCSSVARMDELDRRGEAQVALAAIAAELRADQRQHRPHALAARRDQVAGELGDQPDRAVETGHDQLVDPLHVGFDQRLQRIELAASGHGSWTACWRRSSQFLPAELHARRFILLSGLTMQCKLGSASLINIGCRAMRELLRSNDLVDAVLGAGDPRRRGDPLRPARRPCQRGRGQHRRDPAAVDGREEHHHGRAAPARPARPPRRCLRRSPRTACSAGGCGSSSPPRAIAWRSTRCCWRPRCRRRRARACSMPAPAAALRPLPRRARAGLPDHRSRAAAALQRFADDNVRLNELGERVEIHRGRPRPAAAAPRRRLLRPRDDQPAASRRGERQRAAVAERAMAHVERRSTSRPGSRAACACCGRAAC